MVEMWELNRSDKQKLNMHIEKLNETIDFIVYVFLNKTLSFYKKCKLQEVKYMSAVFATISSAPRKEFNKFIKFLLL